VSTLIEWDEQIPELEVLVAEAGPRARDPRARGGTRGGSMEPTASALAALQQELWQLITAPSDADRADERAIAALVCGDANATSGERLGCTRMPTSRACTTA
jgi:hypothetical protein